MYDDPIKFFNEKANEREKELLLESMVILIDTREKKIDHITNSFDKAGIKYKVKALKYGDYSFILTKNLDLGIPRDVSFEGKVVIERKASLEELSTNLTKGRDRIEKEFALSPYEKVLLVENANIEVKKVKHTEIGAVIFTLTT